MYCQGNLLKEFSIKYVLEPSLGTPNAMMAKPYLRDTCFDINIILNDVIKAYYEYGKQQRDTI